MGWQYCLVLFAFPCLATAKLTNVEIAPGVDLPLLNCGATSDHDRTVWLQAGGKGLDTALSYGDPDQKAVGEAVRGSSIPRSELFVTTKIPCCPCSAFPYGQRFCSKNPQWKDTAAALQHDLDMLGLEYIDLVIMHWDCDTLENTLDRYSHMEDLYLAGKVRAIGVSNFNASLLEAFVPKVTVKPAVNQVSFSVASHAQTETATGTDDVTLAKCKELGITMMAWSPLGGVSGANVLHDPQVAAVAAAHGRSTAQVALRWLVQKGIAAVTSTNNLAHAASDLAVYDFELSAEEMELLSGHASDPGRVEGHEKVIFA